MVSQMSAVKFKCNDDTKEGEKKTRTALIFKVSELVISKFSFFDNVQKHDMLGFFSPFILFF